MNKKLKILMFGWEWPPFNSGGLGVACAGLTAALNKLGSEILFVLPERLQVASNFLKFLFYKDVVQSSLIAYGDSRPSASKIKNITNIDKSAVKQIVEKEKFDLIHAHDWMTFNKAIYVKQLTGKPLIIHIHSTEFDRTGGHNINQNIYEIEKEGMQKSDLVMAVSNYTKGKIVAHYGIDPQKIKVVHNGLEIGNYQPLDIKEIKHLKGKNKLILFVGRLTLQKGPDYFLKLARKILEKQKKVIFMIAGSGDMEGKVLQEAAYLGLSDKILFAGFLRDQDLNKIYQLADIYVMPSVSEPFGITALEAMANGVPALISKQSGVSEATSHNLRADFWDIDEMANKVLAVLNYQSLNKCLIQYGREDIKRCTWDKAAEKCHNIYQELLC